MQPQIKSATFGLLIAASIAAACSFNDETSIQRLSPILGGAPDGGSQSPADDAGTAPRNLDGSDAGVSDPVNPAPVGESPGAASSPSDPSTVPPVTAPITAADAGIASVLTNVAPCTGCARLGVYADDVAYYELAGNQWELSSTVISWRVRVFNYGGSVSLIGYADSGDNVGQEVATMITPFSAAAGWQELRLDLSGVQAFRPASGDDVGFAFDKSKIQKVGLAVRPDAPSTGSQRATLEIDSITFSGAPALNVGFTTAQSGFALVDSGDATVVQVPE